MYFSKSVVFSLTISRYQNKFNAALLYFVVRKMKVTKLFAVLLLTLNRCQMSILQYVCLKIRQKDQATPALKTRQFTRNNTLTNNRIVARVYNRVISKIINLLVSFCRLIFEQVSSETHSIISRFALFVFY